MVFNMIGVYEHPDFNIFFLIIFGYVKKCFVRLLCVTRHVGYGVLC